MKKYRFGTILKMIYNHINLELSLFFGDLRLWRFCQFQINESSPILTRIDKSSFMWLLNRWNNKHENDSEIGLIFNYNAGCSYHVTNHICYQRSGLNQPILYHFLRSHDDSQPITSQYLERHTNGKGAAHYVGTCNRIHWAGMIW
jgi:hypothetical protein